MTTNTEYAAPPPLPPAPRPPLRRAESGKAIAGVAAGFARWLGIDPVIVRVILVVLAIFGGSGLLLYAIGWLFIPVEGSSTSSADTFFADSRRQGSTARTVLIVVGVVVAVIVFANIVGWAFGGWGGGGSFLLLLATGGLVLYLVNRQPAVAAPSAPAPEAGTPEGGPAPDGTTAVMPTAYAYGGSGQYPGYQAPVPAYVPPAPRPRSYLGLATLSLAVIAVGVLVMLNATSVTDIPPVVVLSIALGILGLGILVGTVAGRANWLLWLAIPLLATTALVSLVPQDLGARFDAGIGERVWRPTTMADLATPYELGLGSLRLDLSDLVIPPGTTTIPIDVTLGIGELDITVPDDVRVLVDAQVDLGALEVDGLPREEGQDVAIVSEMPGGPATGPVIDLTARTNVGDLEVSRA